MSTVDETNGFEAPAPVDEHMLSLELTLSEASALRAWLLKPASDGATALEDSEVNSVLKKLAGALDLVEAIAAVRGELQEAGFSTDDMSDEQVAELGRRIGAASQRSLR